jgi:hypothetical protein
MLKINEINRREFAKNLAFSTLGVSILGDNLLANTTIKRSKFGQAKHAIIITLSGGISHIDSFDPKENNKINGGIKPIKTNVDGITLSQYFPGLANHADKFSIIQSMTSSNGAHEGSTYMLKTSYKKSSLLVHPTIGPIRSFLQGRKHLSLPDTVLINAPSDHPKQGYFDSSLTPLPIVNPNEGLRFSKMLVSQENMNSRIQVLQSLNNIFQKQYVNPEIAAYTTLYDETLKTMRSKDLDAFDLTKENKEIRERYGMDTFGQGCLLANRLIHNGISVVEVNMGSFDYHNDIDENMKRQTPILDKALTALFEDLSASGKISETLVVVESEFGRTAIYRENGEISGRNENGGRDHQPGVFSCLIGGCGLGGKIVGKSDEYGEKVAEKPISFGELNSTIAYAMGIKPDHMWMTPQGSTAAGRPMTVGNGAKPIIELVG